MAAGIIYDGFPSMEEIKEANGWPDEERFLKGPVAVVECVQQIPCNPCESAVRSMRFTSGNRLPTRRKWTKKHVSDAACAWQPVRDWLFSLWIKVIPKRRLQ